MKRSLYFAYGVGCHLLFLGIFAYMAAFIGNLIVPKTIDSGPAGPVGQALVVNLLLLGLFAAQHSIMARPAFKRLWTRIVPQPIERSTYVLVVCAVSFVLMWQWRTIDAVVWDVQTPLLRNALWGLFAGGWLMVPGVTLLLNHFDLFGTRQVWMYLKGRDYEPLPFRVPSFYKHVRHPLYIGWTIAFWATPTMTMGHLLFAGVLTIYMALAAVIEERDLVAHFGRQYQDYRRRVPMFVPRLKPLAFGESEPEASKQSSRRLPTRNDAVSSLTTNWSVLTDLSWWHWTLTIPLLAAHLAGYPWALVIAIGICTLVGGYYAVRLRQLRPFPVQIRIAYLGLLLCGTLPGMNWIYWVPLIGTTAMVTVGYCLLARILSLAPWNRTEPLSGSLLWRVFVREPSVGGLVQWSSASCHRTIGCCSVRDNDTSLAYSITNTVPRLHEDHHAHAH